MPTYCLNCAKSEINYTDKGYEEKVKFDTAPIQVECSPAHPCGRPGQFTFTYTTPTNAGGEFSTQGFEEEVLFFKSAPQAGCRNGTRWDLYANCNGTERLVYGTFSCTNGQPSLVSGIVFTPTGTTGQGLVVKDAQGNELFRRAVTECNFQVLCDDSCPDGHLKCDSNEWPGYCCIPCAEIKDELIAIKQLAKRVI